MPSYVHIDLCVYMRALVCTYIGTRTDLCKDTDTLMCTHRIHTHTLIGTREASSLHSTSLSP